MNSYLIFHETLALYSCNRNFFFLRPAFADKRRKHKRARIPGAKETVEGKVSNDVSQGNQSTLREGRGSKRNKKRPRSAGGTGNIP